MLVTVVGAEEMPQVAEAESEPGTVRPRRSARYSSIVGPGLVGGLRAEAPDTAMGSLHDVCPRMAPD